MTPERLEELAKLAAAATPGLTVYGTDATWDEIGRGCYHLVTSAIKVHVGDANLFQQAPTAIPELIAEVRRLTVQRDTFLGALHGVIADLQQYGQIGPESATVLNIYEAFKSAANT